jgi:hypothetical protein
MRTVHFLQISDIYYRLTNKINATPRPTILTSGRCPNSHFLGKLFQLIAIDGFLHEQDLG